jgi:hypothetical protein
MVSLGFLSFGFYFEMLLGDPKHPGDVCPKVTPTANRGTRVVLF